MAFSRVFGDRDWMRDIGAAFTPRSLARQGNSSCQPEMGAYLIGLKKRSQWKLSQVHGFHRLEPSFHDSSTMMARPSRFSSGTMSTPPVAIGKRLSSELSRLSPIMK